VKGSAKILLTAILYVHMDMSSSQVLSDVLGEPSILLQMILIRFFRILT